MSARVRERLGGWVEGHQGGERRWEEVFRNKQTEGKLQIEWRWLLPYEAG